MLGEWGRYRLESLLARGGMAEVFRASATGPSGFYKPVCLKRIRPELGDDPEFVEMFEREARIAALLQHPNIVQVFDFDRFEGQLFLAMEYVEGLDLRAVLKETSSLGLRVPIGFVFAVARGLLAALKCAHELEVEGRAGPVVHRDVSPHNLLISVDGHVKLTDFGIAKARGTSSATREGVVKGKLAYLSPEQARGEEATERSDLFGAGIVLWEMLAGRRLFGGGSDQESVARVLAADVPPLTHLSSEIRSLLDGLLERDPTRRIGTASEALARLDELDDTRYSDAEIGELVRSVIPLRSGPGSTRMHEVSAPSSGARKPAAEVEPPRESSEVSADIETGQRQGGSIPPRRARSGTRRLAAAGLGALLLAILAVLLLRGRFADDSPRESNETRQEEELASAVGSSAAGSGGEVAGSDESGDPEPLVTVLSAPDAGSERVSDAGDGISPPGEPERSARAEGSRAARFGLLEVHCRPWAHVRIDGRPAGTTPVKGFRLPAGSHRVMLVNEERDFAKSLRIEVRPGRKTVVREAIDSGS
ncbi:MAG: serine/threonine-protein kinase [Polyangia bacterium]